MDERKERKKQRKKKKDIQKKSLTQNPNKHECKENIQKKKVKFKRILEEFAEFRTWKPEGINVLCMKFIILPMTD